MVLKPDFQFFDNKWITRNLKYVSYACEVYKKCYIHVIYHSSVHLAKTYFHGSSGVLIQCSYFITASKKFWTIFANDSVG